MRRGSVVRNALDRRLDSADLRDDWNGNNAVPAAPHAAWGAAARTYPRSAQAEALSRVCKLFSDISGRAPAGAGDSPQHRPVWMGDDRWHAYSPPGVGHSDPAGSGLCVAGRGGVRLSPTSIFWSRLVSILYGIGAALTLDEFALWLNLRNVYGLPEGRLSIDAVLLFGGLLLIGVWGAPLFRAIVRRRR